MNYRNFNLLCAFFETNMDLIKNFIECMTLCNKSKPYFKKM